MKQWLTHATEGAVIVIDALALAVIVVGTVEVFIGGLRAMLASADSSASSGWSKRQHRCDE
jgi:hypothetical protein